MDQKQQLFGRVDPFCLFAVLPLLVVSLLFIWGGIPALGIVLIFLAALVIVADSWSNRPLKKKPPTYDD